MHYFRRGKVSRAKAQIIVRLALGYMIEQIGLPEREGKNPYIMSSCCAFVEVSFFGVLISVLPVLSHKEHIIHHKECLSV